ncbi:MAG: sigma-70 family RNA polymerase sigma factor, partial [Candidatus Rokuibacteriota bacterium]
AFQVLRDREEAWDVAQEAFVRAYQALGTFRGDSAFYTWLFRIAMNLSQDRVRQRAARGRAFGTERVPDEEWERTLADDSRGPEAPDASAQRAEKRERIMAALARLPENYRAIIMLSDLEGLSYREIAEVLRIPMGTVMSRLHNARKRLRTLLGPMLVVLLALLATLAPLASLASDVARAQQPGPTPQPQLQPPTQPQAQIVRFGARVLLASDVPSSLGTQPPGPPDERLDRLMPKLRQLLGYREYASIERYRAEVPVGTVRRWPVPGDRELEVEPQTVSGETVRMRVRLVRVNVNEIVTNIQAARGNPAIIGGPRYGDGVLVIVIWANANPEPRPPR